MTINEFMRLCHSYGLITIYFQKYSEFVSGGHGYDDFLKITTTGYFEMRQMLDDYSAMYDRGDIDCDITKFKVLTFANMSKELVIICADR